MLASGDMDAGAGLEYQIPPVVGRPLVRAIERGPDRAAFHLQEAARLRAKHDRPFR